MFKSLRALIGASIAAFGFACHGAQTAPPPPPDMTASAEARKQAFVEALKPQRAGRPVIAIVALNEGTEMTDLLLPHAVLKRANVADVQVVAPHRGLVQLYPALQVEAPQDLAGFDQVHPFGADYVIVPAMSNDADPAIIAWIQKQARAGARIIAVCSGARVAGRANLLDGRKFAGHWYDRSTLLKRHPSAMYVPDQRYIFDRGVVTTTGITASVPTMLALVEALGGLAKAEAVADDLGVASWGPEHDSARFGLNLERAWAYAVNKAAVWRGEHWNIPVRDGMDDIRLALAADAWVRTGHVTVEAASPAGAVTLRSGLKLVAGPGTSGADDMPLSPEVKPVQQLDRTLCEIAQHYTPARRDWVMQEMEYAGVGTAPQADGAAAARKEGEAACGIH
ncbi:thiamine biosynthesis protein ThiJ [Parapusillimonas sp. SGNA-6]|nr:thiamine biosynthesis protein ThiJ [Parapusillimonas sp. SGNA-6]